MDYRCQRCEYSVERSLADGVRTCPECGAPIDRRICRVHEPYEVMALQMQRGKWWSVGLPAYALCAGFAAVALGKNGWRTPSRGINDTLDLVSSFAVPLQVPVWLLACVVAYIVHGMKHPPAHHSRCLIGAFVLLFVFMWACTLAGALLGWIVR